MKKVQVSQHQPMFILDRVVSFLTVLSRERERKREKEREY
jgi:hypothetical protein